MRRSLYILLVIAVAGISALTGALAGGVVVYRTLQQNSAGQPALFRTSYRQARSPTRLLP